MTRVCVKVCLKAGLKITFVFSGLAGWWLVENEEKHLAWFPAPYLEPCEEDDDDDFDTVSSESKKPFN